MRVARAFALILLAAAACGDEGGAPKPPPGGAKEAAKPAQGGGKKGPPPPTLAVYRKVEDVVQADERPTIRHEFRERDFSVDTSGSENRDPFRSYVITQPGVTSGDAGIPVEATDQCPVKKQIARGYGVGELHLVGILSRGTTRYALFSDTRQYGHIVHRGDCVGKEKARVKLIGAGFVTFEITQEPGPNKTPRPPEERSVPLYPKEIPVGEQEGDEDEDDHGIHTNVKASGTGDEPEPATAPPPPPPTGMPAGPNHQ